MLKEIKEGVELPGAEQAAAPRSGEKGLIGLLRCDHLSSGGTL